MNPNDAWIAKREWSKGLKVRENPGNGFCVATIHYTADPRKRDPEWARKERRGMPEWAWQKEYELDYRARSGRRIFCPPFDEKVHVFPFTVETEWTSYRGIDHGYANPTACIWAAVGKAQGARFATDRDIYFYREYYMAGRTIPQNATWIKNMQGSQERIHATYIDPSTKRKKDDAQTTILWEYCAAGLDVIPGDNAVDAGIMEMIVRLVSAVARWSLERNEMHEYLGGMGYKLSDLESIAAKPAMFFSTLCPNLIREVRDLRQGDDADRRVADGKEIRESFFVGDDHAVDAARYIVNSDPKQVRPEPADAPWDSIRAHMDRITRPKATEQMVVR